MSESALIERESPSVYGDVLSIRQITENVVRVQGAMESVMKENVHYGKIPGTPKPSLWKPGAEILNMMFRIAVDPVQVEDLSGIDQTGHPFIRFRVRVRFTGQHSEAMLGSAWGEASTLETKYKWRKAVGKREFDATPVDRRRVKYYKYKDQGGKWQEGEEPQVRTEPDDLANTILQMAIKRAEVSGTKRVTACSDIFAQDLEDLPSEVVASIMGEEGSAGAEKPPQAGQRKSQQTGDGGGAAAAGPSTARTGANEASNTQASSAPASGSGEKSPTGKIKAVENKTTQTGKTYYAVTLFTGFACTTWSESLATEARGHKEADRLVELVTDPPKEPRFPPTLRGIKVVNLQTGEVR